MLIAIIDDGVETSIIPSVIMDLVVEDDSSLRNRNRDEHILTDHGTTCANIIL